MVKWKTSSTWFKLNGALSEKEEFIATIYYQWKDELHLYAHLHTHKHTHKHTHTYTHTLTHTQTHWHNVQSQYG
jgi:hypothetical protein